MVKGSQLSMGPSALLELGGVRVAVISERQQLLDPAQLDVLGVDLWTVRTLVVKSTQHFHAGFAPIARQVLYVSAPGAGSMDMAALPHAQVQRALWPRVADPTRGLL